MFGFFVAPRGVDGPHVPDVHRKAVQATAGQRGSRTTLGPLSDHYRTTISTVAAGAVDDEWSAANNSMPWSVSIPLRPRAPESARERPGARKKAPRSSAECASTRSPRETGDTKTRSRRDPSLHPHKCRCKRSVIEKTVSSKLVPSGIVPWRSAQPKERLRPGAQIFQCGERYLHGAAGCFPDSRAYRRLGRERAGSDHQSSWRY